MLRPYQHPLTMHTLKTHWLRIIVHIGVWIPFAVIAYDALTNHLGPDPIREITLRSGKTALILLMLSLACTPATMFGFRQAWQVRRALGLYAFMYAAFHFFIFIGVDYGFDFALLQDALFEKPYALVGFAAGIILLPIAITSTKGWMKKLGRVWKYLHRGVYIAVLFAIVHFIWLVKLDVREPLIYGAIVAVLLALRLTPIRHLVSHIRNRTPPIRSQ